MATNPAPRATPATRSGRSASPAPPCDRAVSDPGRARSSAPETSRARPARTARPSRPDNPAPTASAGPRGRPQPLPHRRPGRRLVTPSPSPRALRVTGRSPAADTPPPTPPGTPRRRARRGPCARTRRTCRRGAASPPRALPQDSARPGPASGWVWACAHQITTRSPSRSPPCLGVSVAYVIGSLDGHRGVPASARTHPLPSDRRGNAA